MPKPSNIVSEFIHPSTGEIVSGVPLLVPKKISSHWSGTGFMLINQLSLVERTRGLGKTGFTLFMYAIEKADYENVVFLKPKAVGERIGMDPSQVCKGIKRLVSKNVLIPLEDAQHYRISPLILWKGKPKNHTKALEAIHARYA